jgi:hypothetical protein
MTDGHSPTLLDELMRRRMWSYARFAREYRKAAERLGVPGRPPEERQLKRWRAGRVERPRSAACEVLEDLFGSGAPELLAPPAVRPLPAKEPPGGSDEPVRDGMVATAGRGHGSRGRAGDGHGGDGHAGGHGTRRPRRSALRLIGGGAVAPLLEAGQAGAAALGRAGSAGQSGTEALAWSRELERTDIGPGTLAHLEAAVERLCVGYAELVPHEARQVALLYRRQVAALMSGRHTLREGRELARYAGMFSAVLGWLAHDLGDAVASEAYCLDARLHGEHAELPAVCAWAEDCRATVALYAERPEAALAAALRGRAYAPAGTAAEVRLTGQVARACARAGRAEQFRSELVGARAFRDRLPAHAVGLFTADAVRIWSFEASGHRMLGRPDRARPAAEAALRWYREAGVGAQGSPTRLAILLLDLAGVRAADGELDGAVEAGREALGGSRPAEAIRVRAAQLARELLGSHRGARPAEEFAALVRSGAN